MNVLVRFACEMCGHAQQMLTINKPISIVLYPGMVNTEYIYILYMIVLWIYIYHTGYSQNRNSARNECASLNVLIASCICTAFTYLYYTICIYGYP